MKYTFEDTLLLVGKITVLWSQTEYHFERIIWYYTDVEARIGEAITSILGNVSKAQLLRKLSEKIENDPADLDHIKHLIACYDICRENRNIIIHAIIREDDEAGTPIMIKSRKLGGFNVYKDAYGALERVADEVAAVYEYCRAFDRFIWAPFLQRLPGEQISQIPSPDKPPLPRKLDPPQHPEDHPSVRHPLDARRISRVTSTLS